MRTKNNILRILLILTILTQALCGWCNEIKYKSNKCTLSYRKIDGYSVEVSKQNESLKEEKVYIPSEINDNDTTYYVIGIADNAFSGNKHIKKITFSDACDIKYIGEGAFAGCENLTEIELPSTLTEIKPYTFAWCGIKHIEIHGFITKIGERAFTNCKNLAKIEMSENVVEIGNYAFAWCPLLTSFTIPEKTKYLGYEILQASKNIDTLFYNAIKCETSGAYYDDKIERTIGAFENNKGLSEVIFGYKVEDIPEYLLYNCRSVDSLYFPRSIKKINKYALHNTEWYYANNDFVYVNNILYHYKGNDSKIESDQFKKGISSIAAHCFDSKKIKSIQLPTTIQYIGKSAFENCKNLSFIALPYDLEEIDDCAFKNCKSLKSVNFNNLLSSIGEYCFSGCKELEKINLPATLEVIKDGAFYNCVSLMSANIPEKTTTIPAGCFSNCESLEKVSIHENILRIEEYAFAGCSRFDSIDIPWDCEVIGSRAFSHCVNLQNLNINAKSVRIDPLAFYKCESLTDVNLLGANRIGYKAFSNCDRLGYITLGNELKTISNHAFENCRSLSSVIIPSSVTRIGEFAFAQCNNLISVEIENANVNIGDNAFCHCDALLNVDLGNQIASIGKYAFNGCKSLESIEIENPIEKIEIGCFFNCVSLSSITLPQGVKAIENKAFEKCASLTSITLPASIETIGERAFYECKTLNTINLPERVTHIDEMAFWGCSELESITIPTYLEKIGKKAFGNCFNLTNVKYYAENCKAGKSVFAYTTKKARLHIEKTVQTIDDYIFEGMNLEDIAIPNSVIKIGKMAFANSSQLKEIDIKSSGDINIDNSAFSNTHWDNAQTDDIVYLDNIAFKYIGKDMPSTIRLKEGTTDIAANFMRNNHNLKHVVLPQSLKSIGEHAFENCYNLETIEFPNQLLNILKSAFAGCSGLRKIVLPPYLSRVDNFAFENCTKMDSLRIDNAYCSIGVGAFRNCNNLIYAYIGDNVINIEDMAFAFCSNLRGINAKNQVVLPSKIEAINYATFYQCEKLMNKITLPYSVKKIRDNAFYYCRNINSIVLSEKIDSISLSAFDGAYNFTRYFGKLNETYSVVNGLLYSKSKLTLYHCPEGYKGTCVLHKDATKISNQAFANCTEVEHIILSNIIKIEDYAFYGCTNLRKITIGNDTQEIGERIFEGCQSLASIEVRKGNIYYKSVDGVLYSKDMKTLIYCPKAKKGVFKIPKSVEQIADYAFCDCNQLEKVILHKNIKQIGTDAFTGCRFETK